MIDGQRDLEPGIATGGEGRRRRPFLGIAGAIILIVVILLLMLLLRDLDADGSGGAGGGGGKTIMPVSGLPPEKGTVSLWLDRGSAVTAVLDDAGVTATGVTAVGGDRYVIVVPEGSEADAAERLSETRNVIDAGRVYSEGKTE